MAVAKAKKVPREDSNGIDFNFTHGEVLECTIENLSPEIQRHLMIHGLSQKVGDSYAGVDTPEECFEVASDMYRRLTEGDWKQVRAASSTPRTSQLLEAIVRVTGRSTEEVQIMLDSKSDDEKKAIRKNAQVGAAIAQIQAERAAEKAAKAAEDAKEAGEFAL